MRKGTAAGLLDTANGLHCELLTNICTLSEQEADFIESAFTEFDDQLIRTHDLVGLPPLNKENRWVS